MNGDQARHMSDETREQLADQERQARLAESKKRLDEAWEREQKARAKTNHPKKPRKG